jgi:hypothetical protein
MNLKKFILAALMFFFFAYTQNALAGDIFIRKGPKPPPVTQESPPVAAPQEPSTHDETKARIPVVTSVAEYASQYYKECTAKEDTVLNGQNLQAQCACTSQKIVEQMSLEEVNSLTLQTPEGEFQRNRILLQAYAPCMNYPVRAILGARCESDKNIQKTVPEYQKACSCMGEAMATYVSQNGASIIAKTLGQDDARASNPVSALLRDQDFQTRAQAALAECIKNPTPTAPAPQATDPPPATTPPQSPATTPPQ